jgi:hypothetical protein
VLALGWTAAQSARAFGRRLNRRRSRTRCRPEAPPGAGRLEPDALSMDCKGSAFAGGPGGNATGQVSDPVSAKAGDRALNTSASSDCPVARWPSQCHLPRSPLYWPAKLVRRVPRHGSAGTRLLRGRRVRSDRLDQLRDQLARHADGRAWQRLPRVPYGRPQPAAGRGSLAGRRRALLRLRGGGCGGARCAGGTAGAARHPGAA